MMNRLVNYENTIQKQKQQARRKDDKKSNLN